MLIKNIKRAVNTLFLLIAVIASVGANAVEKVTYIHTDALGSPMAGSDANGDLVWKEDYRPYGEPIRKQPSGNKLWYTGKPYDDDIGLSYYGARWYDPAIGRFMGVDPVEVIPENIHHFNRYVYANNNPYRYIDPDGNVPVDTLWDGISIIYDVGKIGVGYVLQNPRLVTEGSVDLAADTAAFFIPYVPAGSTKVARALGEGKSVKDQAADLVSTNAGKHRVTLRSDKQQLEIDLAGKDHNGIPTPHTKVSPRNTKAPDHFQPAYNTSEKKSTLRASTQQDIRTARRYLERQNR